MSNWNRQMTREELENSDQTYVFAINIKGFFPMSEHALREAIRSKALPIDSFEFGNRLYINREAFLRHLRGE